MALFGRQKKEMVLTVPEMSCGHCETRLVGLLSGLQGVASVKADAGKKRVALTLAGDTPPSLEAISAALEDSGYTASLDG